jgi:glutaredoxin-dependent peroxiredoxin
MIENPMLLRIGDRAPGVTLPSHTLAKVSLAELFAQRTTVVVFFPLAFTGTCTEELCALRDDLSAYTGMSAQVVAISVDSPYALNRYRADLGADYLFLSDFNREASIGFGVLRDGTVGPGLLGASNRAVFVVDTDGVVRWVWHETDLDLLPPFEEIRAEVGALTIAPA